jgi:hypothetical protein
MKPLDFNPDIPRPKVTVQFLGASLRGNRMTLSFVDSRRRRYKRSYPFEPYFVTDAHLEDVLRDVLLNANGRKPFSGRVGREFQLTNDDLVGDYVRKEEE